MGYPTKLDKLLTIAVHDEDGIRCKFVNKNSAISTDDLYLMGKLVRDFQWQLYTEVLSSQENINDLLNDLNKRSGLRRPPITIRKLATEYPSAIPVVNLEKGSIIIELSIAEAMLTIFGSFASAMLLRLFGEALSRTPTYQALVRALSTPLFKKAEPEIIEKALHRLRAKREWSRHRITFRINKNSFEIEIEKNKDETTF